MREGMVYISRKKRIWYPGAEYHIMNRGNRRGDIFREEEDYEAYLRNLTIAKSRYPFFLIGYCLMTNHVHLLIETIEDEHWRIIQYAHSNYSIYFNKKYGLVGHLFQGRYTDEIVESAYRKTVEDVPYVAYREAVANMLVHRDYSVAVDSRIEIYSDRIEIVSPGGLPIGMLREEYIEGRLSKPRNRKIADIFLRLKVIKKLATGIRRIKEQYIHQEVKPGFIVSENAVVVVLPYVKESLNQGKSNMKEITTTLVGKE